MGLSFGLDLLVTRIMHGHISRPGIVGGVAV